jgi:hypothetical protein
MNGRQLIAEQKAAHRCRSMRVAARGDDMRARPRWAIGLSEVQEGREAPGCDAAPAYATPATCARVGMTADEFYVSLFKLARRTGSDTIIEGEHHEHAAIHMEYDGRRRW